MRLLIVTQKVDRNDDVLGFFHRWIQEFAKYCKQVTVICLEEGEHTLPGNVQVFSLGKSANGGPVSGWERLLQRFMYATRFVRYIVRMRGEYDSVFVHMNQEYALLGGCIWKLLGKKLFLWRNHAKGNWLTRVAVFFSDKVFCTSPQSFTARFRKTKIMPVGVDTSFFKSDSGVQKKPHSILFLGRVASVKNVDMFVEALRELGDKGVEFSATIAGSPSREDEEYEKMIHDKVLAYGLRDKVMFTGAVSHLEALELYREHELYVNLTPPGSMDKTIFEALASGSKVLVTHAFFRDTLPESWIVTDSNDVESVVTGIKETLIDSRDYNSEIQGKISAFLEKHSLKNLMKELMAATAVVLKKTDESR